MSVLRFSLLVAVAVSAAAPTGKLAAAETDNEDATIPAGKTEWHVVVGSGCEGISVEGQLACGYRWDEKGAGELSPCVYLVPGEKPPEDPLIIQRPGLPHFVYPIVTRFADVLEIAWAYKAGNGSVVKLETVRYRSGTCPQGDADRIEGTTTGKLPDDAVTNVEPEKPTPAVEVISDEWLNHFGQPSSTPSVGREPEPPPPATPPAPEPAGSLVGTVTVMPNKRENGGGGSYTAMTFTEDTAKFEHVKPQDSYRWGILWTYDGVPPSLRPGEEYHVTVTWEILDDTPPTNGAYEVLGGVVAISGDVEVLSAQPSGRDNKVGRYKLRVKPSAKTVRIELGGSPFGTFAIWSYERK